jgi:ParB-like chromosome segregation protein Spo0J
VPYQFFHDLPAAQYEALKADIAEHGVRVPIVVDEYDETIDGHQRRRAAAEVGAECPRHVIEGLNDDEKQGLAVALNAFRRHLSGTERSRAIKRLDDLGWSQRTIAETVGVNQSTVSRSLAPGDANASPDDGEPESGDANASPDDGEPESEPEREPAKVTTGKDGKRYPKRRSSAQPAKPKWKPPPKKSGPRMDEARQALFASYESAGQAVDAMKAVMLHIRHARFDDELAERLTRRLSTVADLVGECRVIMTGSERLVDDVEQYLKEQHDSNS